MPIVNLGLAQINAKVGDLEGNFQKILASARALEEKSHLIIFPELVLTGYPLEDLLLRRDFLEAVKLYIQRLTEASSKFKVPFLVGAPSYEEGKVYNSALLFYKGELLGVYHKRYLPQYGVFEEKRYFTEGSNFLLFSLENVKIGVSICEDIWFPTGLERVYSLLGAQILISINASPYAYGKFSFKENFLKARAEDNQAYVVYVNLVGGQDDLVFDGRSMVISPRGKIVARAKAFEEDLLIVSLDTAEV
ncbi:MAG: nitrilase-related carbon-nitrogen hydrolase, partial [Desulfurococcaceae archaeon]